MQVWILGFTEWQPYKAYIHISAANAGDFLSASADASYV